MAGNSDLGGSGWVVNPLFGNPAQYQRRTLYTLPAPVTFQASLAESIIAQYLMPAGTLRDLDRLRLFMTISKNGTTTTFTGRVRMGTAGTTADTLIVQGNTVATTNDANGTFMDIMRRSTTSVQRLGNGSFSAPYSLSGSDVAAETTIANLDNNPVWVNVGFVADNTTDLLTLHDLLIEYVPKA